MRSHLVVLAPLAVSIACGGQRDRSAAVHVDTLPNGAIHVRSAAPRWQPGQGWTVAPDLTITSPEDGNGSFAEVRSLSTDRLGRIYLLDAGSHVVQQFDSNGVWIRSIGRKGGGPGEFTGPIGTVVDGDRLYVIDQTNVRISVFDTSGVFLTSHPRSFVNMGVWRWEGGVDSAGQLYDMKGTFSDSGQLWQLARLSADSFTVVDSYPLPTYEAGATLVKKSGGGISRTTMVLPNAPTLARQFDPRGYLWFGIGDKYVITVRRLRGDTVRVIERAWTPAPLSSTAQARLDSLVASLRRDGYTLPPLPTSVPAFGGLVLDSSGNLWVAPYSWRDSTWQVFDPQGEWLGPVVFPEPIRELSFHGDHYYGLVLDSLDAVQVVRGTVKQ